MRHKLFLIWLLPILVLFNLSIFQKEELLQEGELIYLQLAPADPRSLMQGDYMRLAYEIAIKARAAASAEKGPGERKGQMVLQRDEKQIARFVALSAQEPLAEGQFLFPYTRTGNRISIKPASYLFQEGLAEHYETARYAMIRRDPSGDYVLSGLADEKLQDLAKRP
ncbi:MAG: GDYXXLXY domain-containing protein [Cohaesibacter sp.]|jgi:uncharacterized membrane-anchored protein|nr:GDYXXLXY domain-containing protein [Cohaesibacter sp.]